MKLIDPAELNFEAEFGDISDKRDLKILIAQNKYKIYFDLVNPSADPILSINHYLSKVNQVC